MQIPDWLKSKAAYKARAVTLSLIGSPRFYNPISAPRLFISGSAQSGTHLRDGIAMVRQEGDVTIWHTPLGELATMNTEVKEHLAFLVGEFQRDAYLSGAVRLPPGAIVLDVGANIGLFTKRAISSGAQHVVSLEPAPGNLRALCWNLGSDIVANRVLVVAKGAWDATDTLRFMVDPKRPGRSSFVVPPPEKESYQISIEVATLDQIVRDLKLPQVGFIKMDIEGAELKALQGAREILRRDKPQLAIAVEHTADRLRNAFLVRELVLSINRQYRCVPGPCIATKHRLAPEVLYFL